ncbi:hypothetical protein ACHAQA_008572 [Verticillium albo-atrum]
MGSDAHTARPDASGQGTADDDSDDPSDYSSVSTIDDLPPIRAYGHTYHGSGTILTPNDESERARQEIQHGLFQLCLDGALTSARLPTPADHPLSILDIGAGTGAWAIAMAAQHPTASIRGIDVSAALLPTAVPPNVVFEVCDANEPWAAQPLSLDFVHVRNLVGGGVRDWQALYAEAFRHLRPGGQIEVAEVRSRWFDFEDDRPGQSETGEDEQATEEAVLPATREFEVCTLEYSERLGIDFDPIPKVSGWLEDVGFERVLEKSDLVPIRASGVDERMRRKGAQLAQLIDYGLECYALALFGRCGRSESDTRDLLQRIRREQADIGVRCFGKVTFVTARKPME